MKSDWIFCILHIVNTLLCFSLNQLWTSDTQGDEAEAGEGGEN